MIIDNNTSFVNIYFEFSTKYGIIAETKLKYRANL